MYLNNIVQPVAKILYLASASFIVGILVSEFIKKHRNSK
jgi:hypothetical protein